MSLLGIFVCLTLSALADAQENEESILERDLQDFVRQFTQQQQMRSPFLFPPSSKRPTTEEGVGDVDRETHELESSVVSSAAATSGVVGEGGPSAAARHQQQVVKETVVRKEDDSWSDVYFVAIVAGCCAVGIFGVISAGFCFYKLQKGRKAAADVDYPAYGVTGPAALSSPNGGGGDRKLAQSAQMYHYQHQKQQMIAVEKAGSTKNTSASDVDSEEEIGEEGDYTVYECPGLAPTGEMEVKNPLFQDDSTPVKSSSLQNN